MLRLNSNPANTLVESHRHIGNLQKVGRKFRFEWLGLGEIENRDGDPEEERLQGVYVVRYVGLFEMLRVHVDRNVSNIVCVHSSIGSCMYFSGPRRCCVVIWEHEPHCHNLRSNLIHLHFVSM